jgi:hypothetical protein
MQERWIWMRRRASLSAIPSRSADVEIEGLTSDDVAAQSLIMSVEVDATAVAEGQEEDEVQEGEAGGVQGDEMGAEGEEDE